MGSDTYMPNTVSCRFKASSINITNTFIVDTIKIKIKGKEHYFSLIKLKFLRMKKFSRVEKKTTGLTTYVLIKHLLRDGYLSYYFSPTSEHALI